MKEIDFEFVEPFELESGETVRPLRLRCTIYGTLNEDKSNAVLVYHALSGSSRIADWWHGVLGKEQALDPSKNAYVCVNYPGSCYGSTSAKEIKRRSGSIPLITAKDVVRANRYLFDFLGIRKFKRVIGASIGGMLAIRHAVDFPETVESVTAIGSAPLSPLGLALNHLQRQAVTNGDLGLARKIALLTYKSSALLEKRFGRNPDRSGENPFDAVQDRFDVAGYLDFKSEEFVKRFESESYIAITKMMDLFELNDNEASSIKAKLNLVGISSDWLFPVESIKKFNQRLQAAGVESEYFEIDSDGGHDAFLAETGSVNEVFGKIESTAGLRTAA